MSLEQDFLAAFETYADELYRQAYFRLSDKEKAEDCVQDAFTRAWNYVTDGGTVRDWKAFLHRTVRNLIIDEYRKHKAISLDTLREREKGEGDAVFDPADTEAELFVERVMAADEVTRVLEKLPEPYREILVLRFLNDMTPREIGELLGEREGTISVRIHRALKRFQELAQHSA